MKKQIGWLLLLIPWLAFSQEVPKERTWIIKLNVPQLLDIVTFPNVSVGVEKKLNRYLSVNAEFGYQFYNGERVPDTIFFNEKGYKANLELRVYPVKLFKPNFKGKAAGLFVGLQGFYRWNQYNAGTGYVSLDPESKSLSYVDDFGVRKSALGGNILLGYQFSRRRFVIEPFLGIGYFNRTIKNFHRQYNAQTQEESNGPHDFFSTDLEEDSGRFGNFLLGFRVGLKL